MQRRISIAMGWKIANELKSERIGAGTIQFDFNANDWCEPWKGDTDYPEY